MARATLKTIQEEVQKYTNQDLFRKSPIYKFELLNNN